MDASLTSRLLTELLPPDVAASVRQHLLHPSSPFQAYKRLAAEQGARLLSALRPLADWALQCVADNQGAAGLLVLLALLAALLVVVSWVHRFVLWWTRLALRVVFWAVAGALGAWVWNRGVVESARDAVDAVASVVGYLAVLRNVWLAEYDRYEGQQNRGYGDRGRGRGR
ncbi:hypothetical protein TPAR_07820 [Tolypocladium paradoxum]|uniref:Uncharacterized protein n=1 Tax=Tolypocladium paradoxum TaxID=94208 RepID=A0A2S4KPB3_9HYPO|nr:hypothetical protein TPAR_07820 [Tolypocladium paradoxum]